MKTPMQQILELLEELLDSKPTRADRTRFETAIAKTKELMEEEKEDINNNGLSQWYGLTAADFAEKADLALKKYDNTEWWKFRERYRTYTMFKSFAVLSISRIISWREEIENIHNKNE